MALCVGTGVCGDPVSIVWQAIQQEMGKPERLRDSTTQGIANIMWSFATLRFYPPRFMTAACVALEHRLQECNDQELSNCLWAIARLAHYPGPNLMTCFCQALDALVLLLSSADLLFLAPVCVRLLKRACLWHRQWPAVCVYKRTLIYNLKGWMVNCSMMQFGTCDIILAISCCLARVAMNSPVCTLCSGPHSSALRPDFLGSFVSTDQGKHCKHFAYLTEVAYVAVGIRACAGPASMRQHAMGVRSARISQQRHCDAHCSVHVTERLWRSSQHSVSPAVPGTTHLLCPECLRDSHTK